MEPKTPSRAGPKRTPKTSGKVAPGPEGETSLSPSEGATIKAVSRDEAKVAIAIGDVASLDPILVALASRLSAGISNDSLSLDATTLGAPGADIVSLFLSILGADSVSISGNVAVTTTESTVSVSAQSLDTPMAGMSSQPATANFDVVGGVLVLQLSTVSSNAWSFGDSYTQLSNSWAGSVGFVSGIDNAATITFASADGPVISGTGSVSKGLNFNGSLSLAPGAGPALSLNSLVSNLSPQLPVSGPTFVSDEYEYLSAVGSFPTFSVSLPIVGAIAFTNPSVGFSAEIGFPSAGQARGASGPVFSAWIEAAADIGFGGPTLPLAMRVPYTDDQGWRFGLRPGQPVAISQLSGFLASFTGLNLFSALPEPVQSLVNFELRSFWIDLNHNFSNYSGLSLSLGTQTGQAGTNKWTIIPGASGPPILALTDLTLDFNIANINGTAQTRGALSGTVSLANTLNISAQVPLPLNSANWFFSCNSTQALPNLSDLAQFLGGQSLAAFIPSTLAQITTFDLTGLSLTYDPNAQKLTNLSLGLAAATDWVIIPDWLVVSDAQLNGQIDDPLGSSAALTGSIGGTIVLGTATAINVLLDKPNATSHWTLNVTSDAIVLPTLADMTKLAGGDISGFIPDKIATAQFTLSDVLISADVTAQQMQRVAFGLSTATTWPIITGVLDVTAIGIFLDLDWTGTGGGRQVSGTLWGDVTFCNAAFWVEASYVSPGWTLSVQLMPGNSLTLESLVGVFSSTLWASLQALGVPNIALSDANVSYATATGNYQFSGTVGPASGSKWTIPLGIANLDIISLGARVTCQKGQDGSPDDSKIYVTGAVTIGQAQFNASYIAGGPVSIDCQLIGSTPISVYTIVQQLCSTDAETVSWTSAFSSLQNIQITGASAQLVFDTNWSLQLVGQIMVDGTEVDGMLLIKQVSGKWEFALAIKIASTWTLSGYSGILDSFGLDKQTWMIAASSFSSNSFSFPAVFQAPEIHQIDRGLDFYASLTPNRNANRSVVAVTQILPLGSVPPSLIVHGLLADPLANSYIEVAITAPADGLAMFGSDDIRLAEFDLRLTAQPSVVLRGDFIFRPIKNPDGSYFHLIVDLAISPSEVSIAFEQQPGLGAIYTWQSAFGLSGLNISLLRLALGIAWTPLAVDGTFGGKVTFEQSGTPPTNTVRPNETPHQLSVARAHQTRLTKIAAAPHRQQELMALDLTTPIDPNGIEFMMGTSILVLESTPPVPYPYMLEGTLINLTLPYILNRFLSIQIPAILSPINFPLIDFHIELPDPKKPGSMTNLKFNFDGQVEIFGLHGEVQAQFDPSHVLFAASMDPIVFKSGTTTLVQITESKTQLLKGPKLTINSQGNPSIAGAFYIDFFDILTFSGQISLLDATNPVQTKLQFHVYGEAAGLANFDVMLTYQNTNYLAAGGTFGLHLTSDSLSGFSVNGTKVANHIDLSKGNGGTGISIDVLMGLLLDATTPTAPHYAMNLSGTFHLEITQNCKFDLILPGFAIDVTPQTFAQLPITLAGQIASNAGAIFASVFTGTAGCFIEFLKIGLFVLEETVEVAKVLVNIFTTSIDDGARYLSDVASTADDVANALWDIFDSHDTEKNTNAMKKANYSSEQTADAIKKAADSGGGSNYTPNDLVRDQAKAGYVCAQVAGGLVSAFQNYGSLPVAAGKLFADPGLTSFSYLDVAKGLQSQYGSTLTNSEALYATLTQIYLGASSLTAQQMANALAPYYSVIDVARTLHTHFTGDVGTSDKMATILVQAYQNAGNPASAANMASALALYFTSSATAITLRSKYPSDTATAQALATLLGNAFTSPALTAIQMATALAGVFTIPSDIVTALKAAYPSSTDTAAKMASILLTIYPAITVGAMAAALVAGSYAALDIAAVLKADFGTDAGSPAQMTALLAQQHYTPADVAPVLKALWPQEAGTAVAVAGFLKGGFPTGSISAAQMAAALKAGPFTPAQTAPALKSNYASDTDTAAKMVSLLVAAWSITGANTISLADMASALQESPFVAAGADGAGTALKTTYPTNLATALSMAQTLHGASFQLADIAQTLAQLYPSEITSAATLVGVLAQIPYAANLVAPVLKTQYASELGTAEQMYTVLSTAYASLNAESMTVALAASPYEIVNTALVIKTHFAAEVPNAGLMYTVLISAYPGAILANLASALSGCSYPVTDVGPILHANYGAQTNTAGKLAAALNTAYPAGSVSLANMSNALGASSFAALDIAPAVQPIYTATPANLGAGLVAGLQSTQPLTAVPLGIAVAQTSLGVGDIAPAVLGGLPTTSAGLMAATLLVASDDGLTVAITGARAALSQGKTLAQAAAALAQSDAKLSAAALGSVYAPPGPAIADLAHAIASAAGTANANAMATGILLQYPTTAFTDLWNSVSAAYIAAGMSLTNTQLAVACAAAFNYIGEAFSQTQLVTTLVAAGKVSSLNTATQILVSVFGSAATPTSMLAALQSGFVGSSALVDPRTCSVAVTAALALSATDADKMAQPLALAFNLTQCPQNVGALSVALWKSNFSLNAVSAALSAYFESAWNGAAFGVVASVFTDSEWGSAVSQRDAGATLAAAAQAVYTATSCNAAHMVAALVATYDLTSASSAATPMGTALKGISTAGARAYSLNEASAAMAGQYGSNWSAADYVAFVQAFNG